MKHYRVLGLAVAVLALATGIAQAQFYVYELSSIPGARIQFNGSASSFSFTPVNGDQWWVTGTDNTAGDSLSKFGRFTGGPWSYGPITVVGPDQTATVTSPGGLFSIADGSGGFVTGNVNWVQVATHGYAGALNATASVNLSGLTYVPGSSPLIDFQNLVSAGSGEAIVSFQFAPGKTLTDLTTGTGSYGTSFSGSIAVPVPEPGAITFLLLATGAVMLRRKA